MIRQFQSKDAERCSDIVRDCLSLDRSIPPALRERLQRAETPESMIERARLFYIGVFESEDRLLGMAGLDMNEIRILCVSPENQRQGIGRALLDHLREMIPSLLFPDVFVYSSIQGAAFYRACGFMEKGAVKYDYDGQQIETVFMILPIRTP